MGLARLLTRPGSVIARCGPLTSATCTLRATASPKQAAAFLECLNSGNAARQAGGGPILDKIEKQRLQKGGEEGGRHESANAPAALRNETGIYPKAPSSFWTRVAATVQRPGTAASTHCGCTGLSGASNDYALPGSRERGAARASFPETKHIFQNRKQPRGEERKREGQAVETPTR